MQLIRRLIAWSCCLGLVVATGVAVFLWVRYTPRFTLERDGDCLRRFLQISSDGRWLLTHDIEGNLCWNLRVWDVHHGSLKRAIPANGENVASPDQRLFAFLEREKPIRIIDWQTGAVWPIPVPARTWDGSFQFSPGGKWIRVVSREQGPSNCIIDVANQNLAWRNEREFLAFTNDDRHVICRVDEQTIAVHEAATGTELAKVTNPAITQLSPRGCVLSPNGRWLLTMVAPGFKSEDLPAAEFPNLFGTTHMVSSPNRGFEVRNAADGRSIWRIERTEQDRRAFCFSADSRRLATWYAFETAANTRSSSLISKTASESPSCP
jgi:hypothetical protein